MVNLAQSIRHAQEQKNDLKPSVERTQLQRLTLSHRHHIEQRIAQELSHNPALAIREEPPFLEDLEPKQRDDDWNEDYGKPEDEYETGESSVSKAASEWDAYDIASNLERAAIQRFSENPERLKHALLSVDHYRIHGCLPKDAAPELHEDMEQLEKSVSYLTFPSSHPTFEVTIEDECVEVYAFPVGLNFRHAKGLGNQSDSARKFIAFHQKRNKLFNDLAYYILKVLQGDFFRQDDLVKALRHLIPISVGDVQKLPISTPLKLDKKSLSTLGDHLVSCRFGMLPFNLFLQGSPALIRMWVGFARKEGMVTISEQCDWIENQIEERVGKWASGDIRHRFIAPLKRLTKNNVKNALKQEKKSQIDKEGAPVEST